jgi:hypothetical protein
MRDIKEGDKVRICWSDGQQVKDAIVENTPSDVGDLWYLRTSTGEVMAINPMGSNFDCFVKENKEIK